MARGTSKMKSLNESLFLWWGLHFFSFSLMELWSYIVFWENPKTLKTGTHTHTLDKTPSTQNESTLK